MKLSVLARCLPDTNQFTSVCLQTSHFPTCLNVFGLLQQNAMEWVAYKQQKFIFHSFGVCESNTRALEDLVSGMAWFLVQSWWGFLLITSQG